MNTSKRFHFHLHLYTFLLTPSASYLLFADDHTVFGNHPDPVLKSVYDISDIR